MRLTMVMLLLFLVIRYLNFTVNNEENLYLEYWKYIDKSKTWLTNQQLERISQTCTYVCYGIDYRHLL